MSAIPLVNLNPQSQAPGSGSVMLKTGHHSQAGNFQDMVAQAADPQAVAASPVQSIGANKTEGNEFSELLELLNILFGSNPDMSSSDLDSLGQTQADYSQPVQDSQETGNSSRAFEGFISEIQNLLAMFQGLFQDITATSQPLEQTGTQGTIATGTGQVAQRSVPLAAVPVQADTSQKNTPITIAPGIALTRDTTQQEPAPTSAHDREAPSGATVSALEDGPETTAISSPTADQLNEAPLARPQTGVERQIEYISLSYVTGTQQTNSNQISDQEESMSGSQPSQPYSLSAQSENLVRMDIKKAVITSKNTGSDIETEIDLLTGSLKRGTDTDTDPATFHFKKLHITGDKNGIEAYSVQTSSDTLLSGNSKHQDNATTGQNNLTLNYGISGQTASQDLGSDTMNQNDPNQQNSSDATYQTGSHTNSVSAAEQTGNFIKVDDSLGKNVASQIADGISQAVKMNKNRAVLHLSPPELGSVKVSITVSHNNHIQASFITDHPETRHILEANMQHLKDSLAQNGFSLGQVNVDVGGNAFANSGNSPHDNQLTPFGDPRMWLGDDFKDTMDSDTAQYSSASATTAEGMHVII